jgi:hypothetical protein
MSERARYWLLLEPVWERISIYDGPETFLKQFKSHPLAQRTLFAAHWCQSEVLNGGFHQFFSNSTGVLAPESIVAFEALGMPQTAALVRNAIAWFGPDYPRDRDERNERLDSVEVEDPDDWNPFDTIDHRFFDTVESEGGGFRVNADRYAETNDG